MRYWLMKSEPDEFSIDALAKKKVEPWNGVRNYQARNFMRDGMKVGDGVLFYHSNCDEPGVVGIARIASAAYPDPTQFDAASDYYDAASTREEPRWLMVDVAFERKLRRTVTLAELKTHGELEDLALVKRGNRLSVMPVAKSEWDFILALE
ncbi:EVE domain-containing protein [Tahibacter amnicola]|uniref:EVE domain-containing protein n=1 Tax=Tahibacter amnicola TaxID=2976241 RepID=A0ABY6BHT8_9GAMM|nr:EVE domain-containing protein [Tahibacter amnicola]UXI69166.1 EVE domain-containing protein [Tahibacter amnicola]